MNSIRVLRLSPSMRSLARVQAEALRLRGADVLFVTSDQHPRLRARARSAVSQAATWPSSRAEWRRIRDYRPDVVISEVVRPDSPGQITDALTAVVTYEGLRVQLGSSARGRAGDFGPQRWYESLARLWTDLATFDRSLAVR